MSTRLLRRPAPVTATRTDGSYAELTFRAQLERFGAHRQSAGMCQRNSPEWQDHMDRAQAVFAAILATWRTANGPAVVADQYATTTAGAA